jgi:hypothetical protein
MGPQNVDTVLIAGKVMKRNGQLLPTNLDMWRRHQDKLLIIVGVTY